MTWEIKQGDREPALRCRLLIAGVPADLTGRALRFLMWPAEGGDIVTTGTPVPVGDQADPDLRGWVEYPWGVGETDVPGLYRAEFEATANGLKRTFPSKGYLNINIIADGDAQG